MGTWFGNEVQVPFECLDRSKATTRCSVCVDGRILNPIRGVLKASQLPLLLIWWGYFFCPTTGASLRSVLVWTLASNLSFICQKAVGEPAQPLGPPLSPSSLTF